MRKVTPHQDFPLRRILRREKQNGQPFVVMACQHAAPGLPASRFSRFYPCPICHRIVRAARRARAA